MIFLNFFLKADISCCCCCYKRAVDRVFLFNAAEQKWEMGAVTRKLPEFYLFFI